MRTQLVEATNRDQNWAKILVGQFDNQEWGHRSSISGSIYPLLMQRGWGSQHRLVLDIETGEGAVFLPGGHVRNDLDKHQIWVCPLYLPFLEWWWERWPAVDVGSFPAVVQLPDTEFQWSGYRRPGPTEGKLP